MRRGAVLALLLGAVLVTASASPLVAQQARLVGGDFRDAERALLEQGRIVIRSRSERRRDGIYFGGTSFQAVERPPAEVWRAVRQPDRYRDLLPAVHSVSVVAREPSAAVIRVGHVYGMVSANYHLRLHFDEGAHDLAFELDEGRPNDVRSARGFLNVAPWPGNPNRTLVSWGILASMDDGLIGGIVRPQLHEWMLRVPSTMRSYLQGRGRTLFIAESDSGRQSH